MIIKFVPRDKAAEYTPEPNSLLISIYSLAEDQMIPQPGWKDVLFLRFHDTDGQHSGLEVFSEDQAHKIIEFVTSNDTPVELVVHCQAGVSRSAAVAIFLSEVHGVPCYKEDREVNWKTWPHYNKLVYRTLNNALNMKDMLNER